MRAFAKSLRLILTISLVAPAVLAAIYLSMHKEFIPHDRCNFGGCWGTGKWDPWLSFVLFFPPGWAAFITITLRDHRNLAWNQYFVMSVGGLVVLQIMNWMWTFFIFDMFIQQIVFYPFDPMTPVFGLVTLLGYLPIWYATYMAFLRLPRPLGQAGEAWWFGGSPH